MFSIYEFPAFRLLKLKSCKPLFGFPEPDKFETPAPNLSHSKINYESVEIGRQLGFEFD